MQIDIRSFAGLEDYGEYEEQGDGVEGAGQDHQVGDQFGDDQDDTGDFGDYNQGSIL